MVGAKPIGSHIAPSSAASATEAIATARIGRRHRAANPSSGTAHNPPIRFTDRNACAAPGPTP